jgi:hypothetical protein
VRTAVEDGLADRRQAGLGWWVWRCFFPHRRLEAAGLQKRVGHHAEQGVAMQPDPGTAFEMIEAQFLLQLLKEARLRPIYLRS